MQKDTTISIHDRFGGQCSHDDIAPYVLVPGSKKRVDRFAAQWDNAKKVAEHYEFLVYTGEMDGLRLTACSTGCGGQSVAIAVDELARLGARVFLRVGVSGAINKGITAGNLVIASSAVRLDKTSEDYADIRYPAIADLEMTAALIAASEKLNYAYHVGVVATAGSMYLGQGTSGHQDYQHESLTYLASDLEAANALDWDTETATLLTICAMNSLKAGRIDGVADDPLTKAYNPLGESRAMEVSIAALKILAHWEEKKAGEGLRYILPG